MTYLTFMNTYDIIDAVENDKHTYKIGKWYDALHISSNPLPLIRRIVPETTSSITLNYLGKRRELLPYIYLLVGKPGIDIPDAEPLEGVYSHMITSKHDILDEIKEMDGVKGYLDLHLQENKNIVISSEEKDIFNTTNQALKKEPKKQDIKEYMNKAAEFAEKIEYYDPTLIVSPLVHGSLLTTSILWHTKKNTAYRVLFPVGGNYVDNYYHRIDDEIVELSDRTIIEEANTIPYVSGDTTEEVRRLCYINDLNPTDNEYFKIKNTLYAQYARFIECGGPNSFFSIAMSNKNINSLDEYKKKEIKIETRYDQMCFKNIKNPISFFYQQPSFYKSELFEDDHEYSYHVFPIKDSTNKLYSRIDLLTDYMLNKNSDKYNINEEFSLLEYLKRKIGVH